MCRLFGFRSNSPAPVHRALVVERNSLCVQSREHKDGWGIAHWGEEPKPNVIHGLEPAHCDPNFNRASQLLSARAVLAHVRLASVGPVHQRNAHPFLFGSWAFAHNGTVQEFADHRTRIESLIDLDLRSRIQGETDSERCFYLFLSNLRRRNPVYQIEDVANALVQTATVISTIADRAAAEKPSSLNFLVTDGDLMVGTRRNRPLFFSEFQPRSIAPPPPADGAKLERFVIASEELSAEDAWHSVPESSVIGVDREVAIRFWTFDQLARG